MKTATFYHAGCPVCVGAEQQILGALDSQQFNVEIVHLVEQPALIEQAEELGVKSVPALVLEGNAFHINYGAAISDLK